MKHLRLLLCLTVVAMFSTATVAMADSYDSETATVQKAGSDSAKIMVGKDTFKTKVAFEDGATWDNVKDHYEMNPAVIDGLKGGTKMISVGADGTLTYKACHCTKPASTKTPDSKKK